MVVQWLEESSIGQQQAKRTIPLCQGGQAITLVEGHQRKLEVTTHKVNNKYIKPFKILTALSEKALLICFKPKEKVG